MAGEPADAIIVGAGLSGLQSALDLHAAGKNFIVLEARDRVGGKTYSCARPDGKGIQELGAAWVNDSNQSHVWEYCKQFQLTPLVQNIVGSVACEDGGGQCHMFPFGELPKVSFGILKVCVDTYSLQFSDSDQTSITSFRDVVETASLDPEIFKHRKRAELDNLTFEQWCKIITSNPQAIRTARLWCRGTLGQDPSDVSALAFLEVARGGLGITNLRYDGKHGAQYLRLKEGTQSISIGMAENLPAGCIHLSTAIKAIRRLDEGLYAVVATSGTTFRARSVVLSIPSTAYRDISFEPALSLQKQSYVSSTRYGFWVKYICLFKTPFWKDEGCCGLTQSFKGPINHCRDTSVPDQGNYALTCFITSTPGRIWSALGESDKEQSVLTQLGQLFGVGYGFVAAEYLGHIESDWGNDKWAGYGCPFPVTPPGVLGYRNEDWFTESQDGLFFVGTELCNEWRGYMEGALRSGKRGAAQALTYLQT
jgi:monoamine oxidase